jgi:hypothetical protein
MTIPITTTLLRNHVLAYGFVPAGQSGQGGSYPLAVDTNGILQVSTASTGGNAASLIQNNADGINPLDFGAVGASFEYAFNGATWDRVRSGTANADTVAPLATGNIFTIAQLIAWNGDAYDRVRIANVYHSVLATAAGNTTVWTPPAGEKFRLMGFTISVAGTLAATGVELIQLTDSNGGTVISQHQATVTITTPTGDTQIGADLGQGYLSAAANNVLAVNLSSAMLTGGVAVNVWGTEE